MVKKNIQLTIALCLSAFMAAAQQDRINEVKKVVALINAKDSRTLLSLMNDSARIGDMPTGKNDIILPAILSKFLPIESYKISSAKKTSAGEMISLDVVYQGDRKGKPSILFDSDGKIGQLNIVKVRVSADIDGALSTALAKTKLVDTARVPFKLFQGLIYVPARLNSREGFFMLDSGSPFTILRKKYVNPDSIDKNFKVELSGMGGAFRDVAWAKGNAVAWAGMEIKSIDAPVAEMNDMELPNGANIFGLLGYGMFADYSVTFDYQGGELILERVDGKGNPVGNSISKGKLVGRSTMEMKRHIPIVQMKVDNHTYTMGIDCGANVNVMDEALLKTVGKNFDMEKDTVNIAGVGSTATSGATGYLKGGKIGAVTFQDMLTVMTDQQIGAGSGDDRLPIVGLLGTPFLNQFRTTINFKKKEISFYR